MEPKSILNMTPQSIGAVVRPILAAYPVVRAWLYGSVARGEQHRQSDVDLIVELADDARMGLDFIDMQAALTKALRHAVDVSTLERTQSSTAFLSNFDNEKVLIYERAAR